MIGHGRLLRGLTPAQLVDDVLGAQRPLGAAAAPSTGDRVAEALNAAQRALQRPEGTR